ncbi:hypothetical protein BP00DRAFT_145191 [Aspergillus indologenus CBS 114.80]|uniref:Secreted protein n=1 Tax=Aspergillus indologenus CBS 114.80 TaxID=1450541 RepID=A0A2V5J4X6_9EURO|nr:hypothetical protein BP00DRAFT_145191 [Aspergillus indologenus CBS 114.80]
MLALFFSLSLLVLVDGLLSDLTDTINRTILPCSPHQSHPSLFPPLTGHPRSYFLSSKPCQIDLWYSVLSTKICRPLCPITSFLGSTQATGLLFHDAIHHPVDAVPIAGSPECCRHSPLPSTYGSEWLPGT